MNSPIRYGLAFALSMYFVFGIGTSCTLAQENQLQNAFRAWQKCQVARKSARFVLKAECLVAKGAYLNIDTSARFPEQDERFTKHVELWLDFANHRTRKKYVRKIYNLTTEKYVTEVSVDLFNGTDYVQYMPRKENLAVNPEWPEFNAELIFGTRQPATFFLATGTPLLLNFGFVPVDIAQPDLKPATFNASRYKVIPTKTENDSIFVIRLSDSDSKKHTDLYVDPTKGYGITRRIKYFNGAEYGRAEIQLKPEGDFWVPESWRIVSTSVDGTLETEEHFQVTSMAFDEEMPASLFEQSPEKGMVVMDLRTGAHYVSGQPGERDTPVSEVVQGRR